MNRNIFASVTLPMQLDSAADGAVIQLIEEAPVEVVGEPFFGGYAEDFLADLGFDMVDEVADRAPKAKRV
jgi:hypothetical protein